MWCTFSLIGQVTTKVASGGDFLWDFCGTFPGTAPPSVPSTLLVSYSIAGIPINLIIMLLHKSLF